MLPDSRERSLVFDAEADGLLDTVTKIWCFYFIDMETNEGFLYHDFEGYCGFEGVDDEGNPFTIPTKSGNLKQGAVFAHKAKQLICHNLLGYDQFLIKKFYPKYKIRYNYPEVRDTLLESQVQWFDRPSVKGYKGTHGLAVWGARLGIRKPEIEDWTTFDPMKLHRCIEDVKINKLTAEELSAESVTLKNKCNMDFTTALGIEHEYRYWCTKQELNGALVNVEHMERCIKTLDKELLKLKDILEPELPPTITLKGTRVTTNEALACIGTYKLRPEKYEFRERNGVSTSYIVKDWHKPVTKWTNTVKGKRYSVCNKVTGEELYPHAFGKIKEAREYAKENFPDVKKFIYPWVEHNTEEIDINTKKHFGDDLESLEIVGVFTKVSISTSRMSQHEKVKLYLLGLGWDTDEWTFKKDKDGSFVRADSGGVVKWPEIKFEGKQLEMSYKGGERIPVTPQISEDSHLTIPDGLGGNIDKYNAYSHRRKFIANPTKDSKGLLNNIRPDGRITCGLQTFGTTAGRASHYNWVNAPSSDVLFGKEIREIVVAPEGKTLVGIDMPSAHPRLLADFTQNKLFMDAVDGYESDPETGEFIGKDYHTVNSILFKLNSSEAVESARLTQDGDAIKVILKGRKKGKGGSYATLYGGSGTKIALVLGLPKHEGEILKQEFLSGLGLDKLLEEIESTWKYMSYGRGSYIPVLGGYYIWCSSKHKIINYKALGSEAVLQKVAIILLNRKFEEIQSNTKQILGMHDETLFEVPDEELLVVKPLIADMYKEAAKYLGLTLDWSSSAMEGKNYYECH